MSPFEQRGPLHFKKILFRFHHCKNPTPLLPKSAAWPFCPFFFSSSGRVFHFKLWPLFQNFTCALSFSSALRLGASELFFFGEGRIFLEDQTALPAMRALCSFSLPLLAVISAAVGAEIFRNFYLALATRSNRLPSVLPMAVTPKAPKGNFSKCFLRGKLRRFFLLRSTPPPPSFSSLRYPVAAESPSSKNAHRESRPFRLVTNLPCCSTDKDSFPCSFS